jgi:hypothetical protein
MKFRATSLLLLLALLALAGMISGCATNEPDNMAVRPWNSPEGWQGGALGGMDYQHR